AWLPPIHRAPDAQTRDTAHSKLRPRPSRERSGTYRDAAPVRSLPPVDRRAGSVAPNGGPASRNKPTMAATPGNQEAAAPIARPDIGPMRARTRARTHG